MPPGRVPQGRVPQGRAGRRAGRVAGPGGSPSVPCRPPMCQGRAGRVAWRKAV